MASVIHPYTVIEDRKGFWVFDTDFEEEVAGPFETQEEAERALENKADNEAEAAYMRWQEAFYG